MNPILLALRSLGGSGSIEEIYERIVEQEHLPEELLAVVHDAEKSNRTELSYRLAWARTYLKKYGLLENSSRGIWALTSQAQNFQAIDPRQVVNAIRSISKGPTAAFLEAQSSSALTQSVLEEAASEEEWKQKLHRLLTKTLTPDAFERLVQRLLRESGFIQVEVTGRAGDGGIDGKGIARIHGLMSFHVLFQCKRY